METDRETGWRKTRANRAVRKRNAHAYASERITPGRETAKRRGQIIFFSVCLTRTHRRTRTNVHVHRGIKNKKK